jgi:hypothetical protein
MILVITAVVSLILLALLAGFQWGWVEGYRAHEVEVLTK